MIEVESADCYVCYEPSSETNPFVIMGCRCRGTLNIHSSCFKRIGADKCSICKEPVGEAAQLLLVREVKEYDENGKLSVEATVLFDPEQGEEVYHGECRYYFEDGRLWIWCNYNKGRHCKFFRVYHKDGQLARETWYK